jgi:hypothetical protein
MAFVVKTQPVAVIRCDREECREEFTPAAGIGRSNEAYARDEAAEFGWGVRPSVGKGSRSAPDLCPKHRSAGDYQ